MNRVKFLLMFFVSVIAGLIITSGCNKHHGPIHRTADFSPDGKFVALITDYTGNEYKKSEISVRLAEDEHAEAFIVYTAPDKMKIYDVYWKSGKIVVFESGESWACPEDAEKFRKENKKAEVPVFDVRILAINGPFNKDGAQAKPDDYFQMTYPCWTERIEKIKDENGRNVKFAVYNRVSPLQWTNISSANNVDLLVYNSFHENGSGHNGGLTILDTRNGQTRSVLDGRSVSVPAISWDGSKIAFTETVCVKMSNKQSKSGAPDEGEDDGRNSNCKWAMKILTVESGAEAEVIMLSELANEMPMWSKDGKYLFIPSESNIAYTTVCDRNYAVAVYSKILADTKNRRGKNDDDGMNQFPGDKELAFTADTVEAQKNGFCRTVRGNMKDEEKDIKKNVYGEYVTTWYSLHKYYADMGIAIRLLEYATYFSVNPETEQILVKRNVSPLGEKDVMWLIDYSGREIREVKYDYVEKFEVVNKFGIALGTAENAHGSVPVLLDTVLDKELPLIGQKQDILILANYNFDHGRYDQAKSYFEQYVAKYGLPDDTGYRLIMIATYRETKDYEKMMKLTQKVPVAELQRYFSASGNI